MTELTAVRFLVEPRGETFLLTVEKFNDRVLLLDRERPKVRDRLMITAPVQWMPSINMIKGQDNGHTTFHLSNRHLKCLVPGSFFVIKKMLRNQATGGFVELETCTMKTTLKKK